jgi:drug/metabolite transporter (DMT)-like permease
MLNKLSPFFAIILSFFILKEKPGKADIIATVIAFTGALFIIRPGGELSVIPSLIGLYGGFGAGTAYVFVRRLGKTGERAPVIVLCFSVFSCIVSLPFLIADYHPMSIRQVFLLTLAGVFASIGQFSITMAYRFAPAKEISVFDYTQVIFAALLGLIFLDEKPHPLSIVGYVIIIGTAIIRWNHLRKLK